MRKRLLLIGVVLSVAIGVVVTYSLRVVDDRPTPKPTSGSDKSEKTPFQFLGGRRRMTWPPGTPEIQRRYVGFYSVQTDYDELVRRAKAELAPLEYKFEAWKNGSYFIKGPRTNPASMVVINRAMRMHRLDSGEQVRFWNDAPIDTGWVTLQVEGIDYQ